MVKLERIFSLSEIRAESRILPMDFCLFFVFMPILGEVKVRFALQG